MLSSLGESLKPTRASDCIKLVGSLLTTLAELLVANIIQLTTFSFPTMLIITDMYIFITIDDISDNELSAQERKNVAFVNRSRYIANNRQFF